MRGTGLIDEAQLRGLYVTGGVAAFVARQAAGGRPDGGDGDGAVESFDVGEYGVPVESINHNVSREEMVDGQWEGDGAGGRSVSGDHTGSRRPTTCDGNGYHGDLAQRGSHRDGRPSKHAVGYTAMAERGGSNGFYPVAPLTQRAGGWQRVVVWIQGPGVWTQR